MTLRSQSRRAALIGTWVLLLISNGAERGTLNRRTLASFDTLADCERGAFRYETPEMKAKFKTLIPYQLKCEEQKP